MNRIDDRPREKDGYHRRRGPLPARHPLRAQRGRPGGPAHLRAARPEHPRPLPPRQRAVPPDRLPGAGARPPARDPVRVRGRPGPPSADRDRRRARIRSLLDAHRLRDLGADPRDRARRLELRHRGEQPDPQLAARRLLRHTDTPEGVLGAPRRARGRRLPRSTHRRSADLVVQLAGAVHRHDRADGDLRVLRVLPEGADPRPLRAPGDGLGRRDHRDRGGTRRPTPSRGGCAGTSGPCGASSTRCRSSPSRSSAWRSSARSSTSRSSTSTPATAATCSPSSRRPSSSACSSPPASSPASS